MTAGDVLDGAFRALRATIGPVALVVLVILAPYQLLSSLVVSRIAPELVAGNPFGAFGGDAVTGVPDDETVRMLGQLAGAGSLLGLLGLVVNLVVGAAVVALVLRVDRGGPAAVGEAVRTGFRRSGATIGAMAVVALVGLTSIPLVVAAGIVVAFVPILGPIVFVVLFLGMVVVLGAVAALIVPIAVAEERGPLGTLGRAVWVLRVRFWRLLGIMSLVLLLVVVVSLIVTVPFTFLAGIVGPLGWLVDAVGATLSSVITIPVVVLAGLLIYLDARVRVEAYDLEVRAAGLEPPAVL